MAIEREQRSNSKLRQLMPPIAVNADKGDVPALDVSGFESATFAVLIGAAAVEPNDARHIQVRLRHSNDNANFVDCTDAELIDAVPGLSTGTFAHIRTAPTQETSFIAAYIGDKRYVKPVIRVTGDLGDGVLMSIAAMLHNPKYRPVA